MGLWNFIKEAGNAIGICSTTRTRSIPARVCAYQKLERLGPGRGIAARFN